MASPEMSCNIQESLLFLRDTLSEDRLNAYRLYTKNFSDAITLYQWNLNASAGFYVPLHGLEICLRNALHREMSRAFTANWVIDHQLDADATGKVEMAQETLRRQKKQIHPPSLVAELSFGFWITLLNKRHHQTLWIPTLSKAFPNAKRPRAEIHDRLQHIRVFRNRVAHYEPIFARDLEKDYETIIETIHWMNPEMAIWVQNVSASLPPLLKQKPL